MNRPWVALKAAVSLDGRIADAHGASRWISGPEARAHGHAWRSTCGTVLIGSGTLHADDPALTTRLVEGRDALAVVLDTNLSCPADAKVLERRPRIYCAPDAPERELPAEIVRVPRGPGGLDLAAVLADLRAQGVEDLLVEGGARVHRSLIEADLADELLLFVAPRILAGGPGFVAGPGLSLADASRWVLHETRRLGDDVLLTLTREGR